MKTPTSEIVHKFANNPKEENILTSTKDIVCAYLEHQNAEDINVHNLIEDVYATLRGLQHTSNDNAAAYISRRPTRQPAVAIEESVQEDYIVCLEDGKHLKMLKRYLKTNYGMTPEQYRHKWDLPATYPMTAPSYAKKRSQLAKDIGLGKK